jgi:membrane protein YqaA with SNARE-associated domain
MTTSGGMLQRLHERIEGFAGSPAAERWLFLLAVIEAAIFPIPPDVLLIALCCAAPGRSIRYAAVCTAGSVAGAMLGYAIGGFLYEAAGTTLIAWAGDGGGFTAVLDAYRRHAVAAIVLAGFTPFPFSVFTIAAGWNGTVAFPVFVPAVIVGRSLRFFLVGGLMRFLTPSSRASWPRLLRSVSIVVVVLFGLGLLTARYLF